VVHLPDYGAMQGTFEQVLDEIRNVQDLSDQSIKIKVGWSGADPFRYGLVEEPLELVPSVGLTPGEVKAYQWQWQWQWQL
jgi:hypothetical protein